MKLFQLNIFKSIYLHLRMSFLSLFTIRIYMLQLLMRKFKLGTFEQRLKYDAITYPGKAYGVV